MKKLLLFTMCLTGAAAWGAAKEDVAYTDKRGYTYTCDDLLRFTRYRSGQDDEALRMEAYLNCAEKALNRGRRHVVETGIYDATLSHCQNQSDNYKFTLLSSGYRFSSYFYRMQARNFVQVMQKSLHEAIFSEKPASLNTIRSLSKQIDRSLNDDMNCEKMRVLSKDAFGDERLYNLCQAKNEFMRLARLQESIGE